MNTWLPPEWHTQSAVQLTWPKKDSDWGTDYYEAEKCFVEIARQILRIQRLVIISIEVERVKNLLTEHLENLKIYNIDSNDSWARDHGPITVQSNDGWSFLDFQFNGWGGKFEAGLDNVINEKLFAKGVFKGYFRDKNNFILEGGSIESNGEGVILTTSKCLLNNNRNKELEKDEIEDLLKQELGAEQILWLTEGELIGDDTDAHIDTLARFITSDTIAYVQCNDTNDPHYESLKKMEVELKSFQNGNGAPFNLVPIPLPSPQFDKEDGHQLPATYVNFLFINNALLVPIYGCKEDQLAVEILKEALPQLEIIPINCSALIQQHGSLHCVTMQYPAGAL